jgi:hypothetical protein
MKKVQHTFAVALGATVLFFGVCALSFARSPEYLWGNYEEGMQEYFKSPVKDTKYRKALKGVIDAAERIDGRVAPGIYAEYGFLLMRDGDTDGAVRYFEKERDAWPESVFFMNKLIAFATGATPEPSQVPPPAQTSNQPEGKSS